MSGPNWALISPRTSLQFSTTCFFRSYVRSFTPFCLFGVLPIFQVRKIILVHIITVRSLVFPHFVLKHKTWDKICLWGIYLSSRVLLVLVSQLFSLIIFTRSGCFVIFLSDLEFRCSSLCNFPVGIFILKGYKIRILQVSSSSLSLKKYLHWRALISSTTLLIKEKKLRVKNSKKCIQKLTHKPFYP